MTSTDHSHDARDADRTATDAGWRVHDAALPFLTTRYGRNGARMALIGIGGGSLVAVSPGRGLDDERLDAVARFGTVRFILAPNHFHNAGIAEWSARWPHARVVAHKRALPRLRRRLPGVTLEDLAPLDAALPESTHLLSPPGAVQGETWVSTQLEDGTAWFVTDAILNQRRLPGVAGLALRAVGMRTGLRTNPFFFRLFLEDRPAYKAWAIATIEREQPRLFVPSHGEWLRGPDVPARLSAAVAGATVWRQPPA